MVFPRPWRIYQGDRASLDNVSVEFQRTLDEIRSLRIEKAYLCIGNKEGLLERFILVRILLK
jgi:hypothetical protein